MNAEDHCQENNPGGVQAGKRRCINPLPDIGVGFFFWAIFEVEDADQDYCAGGNDRASNQRQ